MDVVDAEHRGIPLKEGLIYGPVASRRLGRSLGINLFPGPTKICAFDCVYCQYGRTPSPALAPRGGERWPDPAEVARALSEVLCKGDAPDVITFSGNGEPTLHPQFAQVVEAVLATRDRLCPGGPLAILTSGATVHLPPIRAALARLDLPIVKLDAGDEATFQAINRPAVGVTLQGIVNGLREMRNIILQTLLVAGSPENSSPPKAALLVRKIGEIHPRQVQFYTLSRPAAEPSVAPVPRERLEEIAARVRAETGVECDVF